MGLSRQKHKMYESENLLLKVKESSFKKYFRGAIAPATFRAPVKCSLFKFTIAIPYWFRVVCTWFSY